MKRRSEGGKTSESDTDLGVVPSKVRAREMDPPPPSSQDISPPAEEPQPCSSSSLIRENAASKNPADVQPDSTEDLEPPFIFTGSLHPLLLPNVSFNQRLSLIKLKCNPLLKLEFESYFNSNVFSLSIVFVPIL